MSKESFKEKLRPYVPKVVADRAAVLSKTLWHARHLGELRRNRALRDTHKGERCFVIGNGPSLRKLDLTLLRGETVFTVNAFLQHAQKLLLTPFCHTVVDPIYFDESAKAHAELREGLALMGDALAFFPLDHRAVVERLAPDANVRYLLFAGSVGSNDNADLTRTLPGCTSVNNVALLIAIYLGFSNIYLLGCDLDMLSNVVGVNPLEIRESHFYHEDTISNWTALGFTYASYARAVARMFEGFEFAAQKVKPGQRIFNATAGGLLDVFPRVEFASLFAGRATPPERP